MHRGNAYGTGEKVRRDPSGTSFRSCHEGKRDLIPTWCDAAEVVQKTLPALNQRIGGLGFDLPASKVRSSMFSFTSPSHTAQAGL